MNIALVTETYPPEVNGVAMTLSRLVAGLEARGHRVEVVRPRQKAELATEGGRPTIRATAGKGSLPGVVEFLVPGVPIPFYQSLRMGLPVWDQLIRRWRGQRPDIVHIATEGPLGLAALRAAAKLGLPVSSSFHTNFHAYGGHYGFRPLRGVVLRYLRWFHNRTQRTMAPTQDSVAQLAESGFERLGVFARGVDATLFSPAKRRPALRAAWGVAEADPVAAYVGRIAAEKNLGLAVDTFLAVQARVPQAKFVLVGDGPEREPLARKHPQFIWAGLQRGEDLAAHYASADLFLFPSVTETFGNVVTEALASGLVVLAYDYAAARQHIRHGVNGFSARFDDPAAFVGVAGEIIDRRLEWPVMREAARATALSISWDTVIDRFAGELETIVGSTSRRS